MTKNVAYFVCHKIVIFIVIKKLQWRRDYPEPDYPEFAIIRQNAGERISYSHFIRTYPTFPLSDSDTNFRKQNV